MPFLLIRIPSNLLRHRLILVALNRCTNYSHIRISYFKATITCTRTTWVRLRKLFSELEWITRVFYYNVFGYICIFFVHINVAHLDILILFWYFLFKLAFFKSVYNFNFSHFGNKSFFFRFRWILLHIFLHLFFRHTLISSLYRRWYKSFLSSSFSPAFAYDYPRYRRTYFPTLRLPNAPARPRSTRRRPPPPPSPRSKTRPTEVMDL